MQIDACQPFLSRFKDRTNCFAKGGIVRIDGASPLLRVTQTRSLNLQGKLQPLPQQPHRYRPSQHTNALTNSKNTNNIRLLPLDSSQPARKPVSQKQPLIQLAKSGKVSGIEGQCPPSNASESSSEQPIAAVRSVPALLKREEGVGDGERLLEGLVREMDVESREALRLMESWEWEWRTKRALDKK